MSKKNALSFEERALAIVNEMFGDPNSDRITLCDADGLCNFCQADCSKVNGRHRPDCLALAGSQLVFEMNACQHQLTKESERCKHRLYFGTTCYDCVKTCPVCWDQYSSSPGYCARPGSSGELADRLKYLLNDPNIEVKFGLRQQGKFDYVHEMYLSGESWSTIAKEIGWSADAVEKFYLMERDLKK